MDTIMNQNDIVIYIGKDPHGPNNSGVIVSIHDDEEGNPYYFAVDFGDGHGVVEYPRYELQLKDR